MSLNDSSLEGDFTTRLLGENLKMKYNSTRLRIHSLVGTKVLVSSLDGVATYSLLCTLVEISELGFLFKVHDNHKDYPPGSLVFASSCSFKAQADD